MMSLTEFIRLILHVNGDNHIQLIDVIDGIPSPYPAFN